MDPVDLYALLGNALDNAMESVRHLEDPLAKTISLSLFKRSGIAVLQIENCYEGVIRMKDGLPATSKTSEVGWHGFGMKSMQGTAEKYGGVMDIRTDNGVFLLRITLPLAS